MQNSNDSIKKYVFYQLAHAVFPIWMVNLYRSKSIEIRFKASQKLRDMHEELM
jgi:hypothetical protein